MMTNRELSDDERFADWQDWVETIYRETIDLGRNRRMFKMLREVAERNERLRETGGHVLDWMFGNYVVAAAMTFRRELDKRNGTRNLRHLLHDIEKYPHFINRRRYRALWGKVEGPLGQSLADQMFDRFNPVRDPDDPEKDHVDPATVRRDREALIDATELVRQFVEQKYAHRTECHQPMTFGEFPGALDAVVPTFKKYYALLTQKSVVDTEPVPQFDTHECLTFPWWQQ